MTMTMDYTTFFAVLITATLLSDAIVRIYKRRTKSNTNEIGYLKKIEKLQSKIIELRIELADMSVQAKQSEQE